MTKSAGARDPETLTEFESCVLGVIWRLAPCSAYAVRRVFAVSVSTTWSASAGSIYPAIGRLERLGLVRARALAADSRGRRNLSLSAKGTAALRSWIVRLEPWAAAPIGDPIRTRLFFLDALGPAERNRVLEQAQSLTQAALAEAEALVRSQLRKSQAEYLASLGATFSLEARLRWLRTVRETYRTAPKPRRS